jgi:hypothetical protein
MEADGFSESGQLAGDNNFLQISRIFPDRVKAGAPGYTFSTFSVSWKVTLNKSKPTRV